MHRTLAVLACWLVLVTVGRGDPGGTFLVPGSYPVPHPPYTFKDWGPLDSDESPGAVPGGIVVIRQGDRHIVRFGGGLLPMKICIREPGPYGPLTERMVLPSAAQSSLVPLALQHQAIPGTPHGQAVPLTPAPDRACVQVAIPDPIGLLYVDGRLTDTRGTTRLIESPPLERGKAHVFRLRAGFKVGDNLLIEEKEVVVRAGEPAAVTFDGARATAVPLPRSGPQAP
jgi:uncharacterized protein (TIGR03000 family)